MSVQRPDSPVPLCWNCTYKWTNNPNDSASYRCRAPQNLTEYANIVTGYALEEFESCKRARQDENACGFEARWFVKHEYQQPLVKIASLPSKSKVKISLDDLL